MHHQLQALVLHAGPPERRLHVFDGGLDTHLKIYYAILHQDGAKAS
jgi:hypothetical protein